MKTINRTVLTVFPKQPYIDWANSFDEDGPIYDVEANHSLAVLIPGEYDEYNYEKFLRKNFSHIFEEELDAWMSDPDVWPKNRTYKKFNEWFKVLVSDAVIDLGTGPVEHELF